MRVSLVFNGKIGRPSFAFWSSAALLSQHLLVLAAFGLAGRPLETSWQFVLVPLKSLLAIAPESTVVLALVLACYLAVACVLVALGFRRASDAHLPEWIAVLAMLPAIQIPLILFLSLPRSQVTEDQSRRANTPSESVGGAVAKGLIAGVGLTLFAVVTGALVFGIYGYGMFVISPFAVGATTAFLANRQSEIGFARTNWAVFGAIALGGGALVLTAIEGVICIIMAAPLAVAAGIFGGIFGQAFAEKRRRAGKTLSAFAVLPIVFALEGVLTHSTYLEASQTIRIDAPPEVVWQSIVTIGPIEDPPALPFRLGVAYAVRGEIVGDGVGAIRLGTFSTGTSVERVTEWIPGRKLAFVVLHDVPAMTELSPYEHVHAPHAVGYFRTIATSFEIFPRPDGSTDLTERSSHEMRLEPAFYWLPVARWVMHENLTRVLAHIQGTAERASRSR